MIADILLEAYSNALAHGVCVGISGLIVGLVIGPAIYYLGFLDGRKTASAKPSPSVWDEFGGTFDGGR